MPVCNWPQARGRIPAIRSAPPLDPLAFLGPRPVDLSRLHVAWTEDLGQCDVDPVVRRAMRARIEAIGGFFAACDEVSFDLG